MRLATILFTFFMLANINLNGQQSIASIDNYIGLTEVVKEIDPSAAKAPKVHAPQVKQEENNIHFSWDVIEKPLRFEAQYEVKIFQRMQNGEQGLLLFQNITRQNELQLEYPERFLNTGTDYLIVVNSRLTGENTSFIIDGIENQVDFQFIPKCTPPLDVHVAEVGKNHLIIAWQGMSASPYGIQYEIRYGETGAAKGAYQSVIVEEGLTQKIDALLTEVEYTLEVRKLCNVEGAEASEWVGINQMLQQRVIKLPQFNCGDDFDFPDYETMEDFCFEEDPMTEVDGIIYIGGFPIFLDAFNPDDCVPTGEPETEIIFVPIDTTWQYIYDSTLLETGPEDSTEVTREICDRRPRTRIDTIYSHYYLRDTFINDKCWIQCNDGRMKRLYYPCGTTPPDPCIAIFDSTYHTLPPGYYVPGTESNVYLEIDTIYPRCIAYSWGDGPACNSYDTTAIDTIIDITKITTDSIIRIDTVEIGTETYNCRDTTEIVTSIDPETSIWDKFISDSIILSIDYDEVLDTTGYTGNTLQCNCMFSGIGVVPLPFLETKVRVEFFNVLLKQEVDPDGTKRVHIVEGQVDGIYDEEQFWPELEPEPAIFGDICVTPPPVPDGTTTSSNGFDENGQIILPPHSGWVPPMPYDPSCDPYGFGADGIHKVTGTNEDERGCTQQQYLNQPAPPPCDDPPPPYAWLQNPVTVAGSEYAITIEPNLEPQITQILNQLKTANATELSTKVAECNGIRTTMEGLVTNLSYDRVFVFGPNDDYFISGMSDKFTEEPQELKPNITRNSDAEELEKNHIALYHCDKAEIVLQRMDAIFSNMLTETGGLKTEVLDLVRRLDDETIQGFIDDPSKFEDWLTNYLKAKASSYYQGTYSAIEMDKSPDGHFEIPNLRRKGIENNPYSTSSLMASMDDEALTGILNQTLDDYKADIDFQVKQGWKMINGRERVYYLEGLVKNRKAARFTGMLTEENEDLMPIVVINRGSNGKAYAVYLDDIHFTPSGGTADAHIIIEVGATGEKIAFMADDMEFLPTGPSVVPMKLTLSNDVGIRLNNASRLILKGTPETYVSFDCKGFAGLGIDAEVEFCRNFIIPYDPNTDLVSQDEEELVKARFKTSIKSFDDFFLELSIDPFVVKDVEDVKWIASNITLDFSDTESPSGVAPKNYVHPHVDIDNLQFQPLWKGFYMEFLEARFPSKFADDGDPVFVKASSIVIDDGGFSGSISASNLLPLERGNAGGWAFSIDDINVVIIRNQLKEASMLGKVNVPIFKSAASCGTGAPNEEVKAVDCFDYDAFMEPGNVYHFAVDVGRNGFCVDMMKAGSINIAPNSGLSLTYENDEFDIEANLTGEINIGHDFASGKKLSASGLRFQNLIVRNKPKDGKGYFEPGTWEFPDVKMDLGGFDLTIDNIMLTKSDGSETESELHFGTAIELVTPKAGTGENKIDLNAKGSFSIKGEMVMTPKGRQKWVYKSFKMSEFAVDGSFPGVPKIAGQLKFFENDNTYGKGFRGMVAVKFKGLGADVGLSAMAQFGAIGEGAQRYKYFLVDLYATSDPAIPLGGLEMPGFGGGVYYHMSRSEANQKSLSQNITPEPTLPTGLGQSLSGITYEPDRNAGVGVKINVALQVKGKPSAFNGNATFVIEFNDGGGLKYIGIGGNARFMDDPDIAASNIKPAVGVKPNNGAPIQASLQIDITFKEGFTLDGDLEIHIDSGNGLTGGGKAELYIGPDGWFINIGTPSERIELEASLAGLASIGLSTYLDIGTKIPPFPDLPPEVASLTGLGNIMANENTRATGRGFAFGARFDVGTGDKKYFPSKNTLVYFYGGVNGYAGFDLMLQDFGDAVCVASGQKIGINGWYAAGQAYAYVQANIGVGVKVLGRRKEFDVLDMAAAAALQMKLPNPFVARGAIAGRYSVLGGLKKGKINFQFTLGESCQIAGGDDPASDVNMILSTYPENGAQGVSTDAKPSVLFNIPIGESFDMADIDGETVNYTAKVEFKQLRNRGVDLATVFEWSDDKTQLNFKPYSMLPPNDSIELEITVKLYDDNSVVTEENRIVKFYTAGVLDVIPPGNVIASYPLDGQYNFYPKEDKNEKGYILLAAGQPEIFDLNVGEVILAKFVPRSGGSAFYSNVDYQIPRSFSQPIKVEFDMPSHKLVKNTPYFLLLMKGTEDAIRGNNNPPPPPTPNNGGVNTTASSSLVSFGGVSSSNESPPTPKTIYSYYFRVSEYDRFFDKIGDINSTITLSSNEDWNILAEVLNGKEKLDAFELNGTNDLEPLVSASVRVAGGMKDWFRAEIKPLYDALPINKLACNRRFDVELAREINYNNPIPEETVGFISQGDALILDQKSYLTPGAGSAPLSQYLSFESIGLVREEFEEISAQLKTPLQAVFDACIQEKGYSKANECDQERTTCITEKLGLNAGLKYGSFPEPNVNEFTFNIQYRLPGTGQITSQRDVILNIP